MIKDAQVRKLRQLLGEGYPLYRAALKVGMDAKTARKYRHADRLPSESLTPRTWRTREDPFQDVWPQLRDLLELNPGLQAKTLFEDLQRRFPGRFPDIQLRTLQRKIKAWRATEGPAKEVFFDQIHRPGQLAASDFTHMNDLHVTLAGEPFDHMVYHLVLTYSNWETATVCFSESFESLSQGLQNALWELGGVPQMHRTDRLSAAVNNLGDRDLFQQRYRALLAHYGLKAQAINARKAHENGDAEQSHHRFKTAVDQALMLRGSRDFEDREDYERFLRELQAQRNSGRTERFGEDRSALGGLPARRVDAWRRCPARVTQGSTIRIGYNTYSVPSRLIGEKVDVHIKVECLEVWHGVVLVERLPRLRGRNKHEINYRHVIDWLGAQAGSVRGVSLPGRDVPDKPVSPNLRCLAGTQPRPARPGIICGSSIWRPSNPRPGSMPCWAGSWSGMYQSRRPSSPTIWPTTWACRGRWRSRSQRWICRCTTDYSRPGRTCH